MKDVKGFHIEESKLNPGEMILVCVAEDDQKFVVSGDHWNPSVLQPYSNNENGKTALRNYQMPLEKQQSVGRMEREPKELKISLYPGSAERADAETALSVFMHENRISTFSKDNLIELVHYITENVVKQDNGYYCDVNMKGKEFLQSPQVVHRWLILKLADHENS